MCLVTQLLSGIALAMHFTPHVDLAFLSVEHIMRDVNGGWLIRYIHANGASMFFYYRLYSYSSRLILWFLHATKRFSLNFRGYNFDTNDGYGFYGLRSCLGSNEFLGCNCDNKFFHSFSNYWRQDSYLTLRRFFCG